MATITPRGLKEVVAGNVSSQKQKQRYPHDNGASSSNVGISLNDFDSDDDEPPVADPTGPHQPPRIAEWRSNLVALSQRDNLYFAAYQDKIHVTIPRGLKQTLSGKPNLILDPPRSKEGIRVGGYIDRANGHCVNHLIVGNLGKLEILLLSCDDGDVLAYYTHTIQAAVESKNEPQRDVRPFFHENVGISAWGLAVHEQSRIIAVSSNNREVVIFKYGCTSTDTSDRTTYEDYDLDLLDLNDLDLIEEKAALFPTIAQGQSTNLSNSFRKVLKLSPEGHNIPSIDFSNDANGEAHSVLATDIVGNLWIFHIWGDDQESTKRLPTIQKAPSRGNSVMGWGALVLPLRAFKRTSTPEEALGIAKLEPAVSQFPLGTTGLERHFDITYTIPAIKDSSKYHPLFGYGINGPAIAGTPTPAGPPQLGLPQLEMFEFFRPPAIMKRALTPTELHEHARKYFEEVINNSLSSKLAKMDNVRRLARFDNPMRARADTMLEEKITDLDETEGKPLAYHLQDRCAILRTYQDDIELIPPVETMPRTVCRKVLKQSLPVSIGHQVHFERLILHNLIVELGLVIVGSQVGRVALVSLTRPEDSFSQHGPVTMFRVDGILPTKKHEDEKMRPPVPLLGIAVSPLQGQQMRERRRWRLILHYYDHSILSYELSREGDGLLVL